MQTILLTNDDDKNNGVDDEYQLHNIDSERNMYVNL